MCVCVVGEEGGGAVLAVLKRGNTTSFEVVLTRVTYILAILKGAGAQQVFLLQWGGGGGRKKFQIHRFSSFIGSQHTSPHNL